MAPSMKRLKIERKTLEKNRRLHMKCLCLKLSSLIPNELKTSSKSSLTQEDNLDLAATYIEKLRERVERLKEMKKVRRNNNNNEEIDGEEMPVIEVRLVDSNLEVVLIISKLKYQRVPMFHEVISVLEEEGAETTNASFSIVSDKIFHTIHSKIICSQIEFNASRILERLQEMVH
ncbi:hypothetical protein J5N97_004186 [Dioscorea zingiberensis]|uniref:BHLH domain-containing protein n=1 Tax=Dioscorea zingiberensis TaxID=325984 RepID=A0A9D5HQR2_9LILI|nr:hypothetical protein J5N97_004186 [Dioscorea zingiberensis]